MKAIYSCKLYKSSSRKEKIQAAIADPVNAELVSQLAEYLDEEYQTPEFLGQESESDSTEDTSSSGIQTSHRSAISSHGGGSGTFNPSTSDIDDIDLTTPDDLDESLDTEEGASEEGQDVDIDVEESFDDEGQDVDVEESTEILDDGIVASSADIVGQDTIQDLKETLNENEETQGVNRVLIKENELWIHYNDNINLNNIMGSVIELMNSSGYTYLEFNRLARSVNAIVFEICKTNSISTESTSGGE